MPGRARGSRDPPEVWAVGEGDALDWMVMGRGLRVSNGARCASRRRPRRMLPTTPRALWQSAAMRREMCLDFPGRLY
ncbi:MAG: hypothetical protein AMXMBFR64_06160 [Myxococcales bacterium]